MTLSPSDDRNVKARPDLPPYFLNEVCAEPGSAEPATENHHLWRRSIAPSFREAWWVELSDGTILPNRVGLSVFAHQKITENKARIIWLGPEEGFGWLEKDDADEWELIGYLDPQPPTYPSEQLELEANEVTIRHRQLLGNRDGKPGADSYARQEHQDDPCRSHPLSASEVAEGDDCPTCGRRKPHAKKAASPKTKVFSVRVPLDDADTFSEMLDAAAEHLGLKSQPHGRYFSLVAGLVLALQAPKNVMEKS